MSRDARRCSHRGEGTPERKPFGAQTNDGARTPPARQTASGQTKSEPPRPFHAARPRFANVTGRKCRADTDAWSEQKRSSSPSPRRTAKKRTFVRHALLTRPQAGKCRAPVSLKRQETHAPPLLLPAFARGVASVKKPPCSLLRGSTSTSFSFSLCTLLHLQALKSRRQNEILQRAEAFARQ